MHQLTIERNKKLGQGLIAMTILFVLLSVFTPEVFAADADAVFSSVTTKGERIAEGMQGWVVVIATIAIMIVGLMMYKGQIGNRMAYGIIIGTIVAGAAGELAAFLISS